MTFQLTGQAVITAGSKPTINRSGRSGDSEFVTFKIVETGGAYTYGPMTVTAGAKEGQLSDQGQAVSYNMGFRLRGESDHADSLLTKLGSQAGGTTARGAFIDLLWYDRSKWCSILYLINAVTLTDMYS